VTDDATLTDEIRHWNETRSETGAAPQAPTRPDALRTAASRRASGTRRILLVSAFNSGLNTGMLTVDLGFLSYMLRTEHLGRFEVHHVNAEKYSFFNSPKGGKFIEFHAMDDLDLDLEEYDRIVYWGDFLHSRRFQMSDLLWRWGKPDEAQERRIVDGIFRNLLLEDAPDHVLQRVIVFGSSLYINNREDEADPRYAAAIKRLYANARLLLLRDPVSAYYAQRFGGHRDDSTQGLDCAFLLRSADLGRWLKAPPEPATQGDRIGFSLGRTIAHDPSVKGPIMELVNEAATQLGGGAPIDIDWLPPNWDNPIQGLSDKLRKIRQCRLVITDTYHCTVNAWREGVPAICVGRGVEKAAGTFDDKKKELLYAMFNIRDYYLFSELFRAPEWNAKDYAAHAIAMCGDRAAIERVREDIAAATAAAEWRLTRAIMD